jgi:hypothetical protein
VWPPARYEQLAKNQSYLFKVNIIADDIVIWVTPKNDSYTHRDAWEVIRSNCPRDIWLTGGVLFGFLLLFLGKSSSCGWLSKIASLPVTAC